MITLTNHKTTPSVVNQCSYATSAAPATTSRAKIPRNHFFCAESALEQYMCNRCPYKTMFCASLRRHVKRTHYIETRGYAKEDELEKTRAKCKSCNFITYSRLIFLKHVHSHCVGAPAESALDGSWLKCDQCPYKTESNFFLTMHKSAEHGAPAKDAGKPAPSAPVQTATRCRFCVYEGRDTADLRAHFLSEHTETTHDSKSFSCKKCHYVTRSKKGVLIHMKMKHKEAKSYPCPYCSFRGLKPSSLEQHMWKKYAEHIEWFNCKKCTYKTAFQDALKKHDDGHKREIDSDEKRF